MAHDLIFGKTRRDWSCGFGLDYKIYEVSPSDFDAASWWMRNFAENVRYARLNHGDRVLTVADVDRFNSLLKRWTAFAAVVNDEGSRPFLLKVAEVTSPALYAGRKIAGMLDVELMSAETKLTFDAILADARRLREDFAKKGLGQSVVPYAGEVVHLLRTLPPALSLADMAKTLRAVAQAGDRMLSESTPWWKWRRRDDARPLRAAVEGARKLADELESVSRTSPGKGLREKGTPVYDRFVRTISRVYVEAAGLYGIEETLSEARAELKKNLGEKLPSYFLWAALGVGGAYLAGMWIARPRVRVNLARTGERP